MRRAATAIVALLVVVLGACLLSACGGAATAEVPTTTGPATAAAVRDAGTLNRVLAQYQRTIAGYTAAGPLLSGSEERADGWFLGQQLSHAGDLRAFVHEFDGTAHNPDASYQLGHPRTARQILGLLAALERTQIATGARAITELDRGWLRARLAAMIADDAQQLTIDTSADGDPTTAAPLPFTVPHTVTPDEIPMIHRLLAAEVIARDIDSRALRSGTLRRPARAVGDALVSRDRAWIALLTRLGGPLPADQEPALTPTDVIRGAAARGQDVSPHTQRSWLNLLEDLRFRLEGLDYYVVIPHVGARGGLTATALLATQAEESVLLNELRQVRRPEFAAPAALVRGWKPQRDWPW